MTQFDSEFDPDSIKRIKAAGLREVADEMDEMMKGFKHGGQWTRAGWAISWVRHRADKLQKAADGEEGS